MDQLTLSTESPFDAIRRTRPDGSEFWSARDLQPLMEYATWRNFEVPLDRARAAALNQGMDTLVHFAGSRKVAAAGPNAADYELSREAAYLVAMNGDPNKAAVAAAQAYFVVRTRQAEVARPAMPTHAEALRGWALELEAREAAEERNVVLSSEVAQLTPKAHTFDVFLGATGDYSVGETAKILCRDAGIEIGEKRLFAFLEQLGWVYRVKGRPIPYQAHIDNGRLVAKARWYTDDLTGEQVATTPQVRVTARGLTVLHTKLIAKHGAA